MSAGDAYWFPLAAKLRALQEGGSYEENLTDFRVTDPNLPCMQEWRAAATIIPKLGEKHGWDPIKVQEELAKPEIRSRFPNGGKEEWWPPNLYCISTMLYAIRRHQKEGSSG